MLRLPVSTGRARRPGRARSACARMSSHEPFNPVQTAAMACTTNIAPHAPRAVGAVACEEARSHLLPDHRITYTARTGHASEPCIEELLESTARDTARIHVSSTGQIARCFATKPNSTSTPLRSEGPSGQDPREIAEDVTGLGRWGNGDIQVVLSSPDELDYVMTLVQQSYEQNRIGSLVAAG